MGLRFKNFSVYISSFVKCIKLLLVSCFTNFFLMLLGLWITLLVYVNKLADGHAVWLLKLIMYKIFLVGLHWSFGVFLFSYSPVCQLSQIWGRMVGIIWLEPSHFTKIYVTQWLLKCLVLNVLDMALDMFRICTWNQEKYNLGSLWPFCVVANRTKFYCTLTKQV